MSRSQNNPPPDNPRGSRFSDMSSYFTETSSITNPTELGISYSGDDEVSSATSALTGLTGWTSAHGGGGVGAASGAASGAAISEANDSKNFPLAHAKSKSTKSGAHGTEASGSRMETVSEITEGIRAMPSAISFDMDGSVEANLADVDRSNRSKGSRGNDARAANPAGGAIQFRSQSKGSAYGGGGVPQISPSLSNLSNNSGVSIKSNASKKRAPVPPLRDPSMDDTEEDQMWEEDCNYDINPTLMYLVLESRDWQEAVALMDGKGLENKNDAWNLGHLFGGAKRKETVPVVNPEITRKRKNELRAQARTWIVRRERNGVLRWRMLPLHASLAFGAPFDVVLRLYHLYPGAVRCRNDQGMLPLHHCFKFGTEDKVLELLIDVFPEANTVVDDRGRLPLACTPKDGSDNERRSNILTLFSNFQVDLALSMTKTQQQQQQQDAADALAPAAGVPQRNALSARDVAAAAARQPVKPQSIVAPLSPSSTIPTEGTLGAAPRYTSRVDYNPVTFNAVPPPPAAPAAAAPVAPSKIQAAVEQATAKAPATPTSSNEDAVVDRYAMFGGEDSENNPSIGNSLMGLSPIPEEGGGGSVVMSPRQSTLKSELLALGEKKKKKRLRKLFGRRG